MPARVLGLDIGGANLKAASRDGRARSIPFALWKQPERLPAAIAELIAEFPGFDQLAITMTGELCDCYSSKREGVNAILDAVEMVAGGTRVCVWQTSGRFVTPAEARATAELTGSANWLALATFAGRFAPEGPSLLIDIGSTTTDLVPLVDGRPCPRGRSDPERLAAGELLYWGVLRTPLCAVFGQEQVRLGAKDYRLAAEFFATMQDVYLLLGALPETPTDRNTADARPATRAAAHARLARMLCGDAEFISLKIVQELAAAAVNRQRASLREAVDAICPLPRCLITSGCGEFVAAAADLDLPPDCRRSSLTERLGSEVSKAACAYAVAVLAMEMEA